MDVERNCVLLELQCQLFACILCLFVYFWRDSPQWASSFTRFLYHTRRTTVGRTPLDEWSARRRDLPDNTQHSQQTDIHAPVGFEPTISAGEQPQTHALDREPTGNGACILYS